MRFFDYEDSDESAQQQVQEFFDEPNENEQYVQLAQIGLVSSN